MMNLLVLARDVMQGQVEARAGGDRDHVNASLRFRCVIDRGSHLWNGLDPVRSRG